MKKRYYISFILTLLLLWVTYPYWLIFKSFHSVHFDALLFIIILICGYLFIYKITDYLSDFKSVQNQSRTEIIFLIIFFIFLFLPMSHINQDKISEKENRTLAAWIPLVKDNKINYDFGKNFEAWFNDRFNFKKSLVQISNYKTKLAKNWQTKDVIKGKDGWLFLGWDVSIISYNNSESFSSEELNNIAKYLKDVNDYCKKYDKKFYFIIAPDKSKIYPEKYSNKFLIKHSTGKTEQLISYLAKYPEIKVIYPKEALLREKSNGITYWKKDTHWNKFGAYVAYKEIIKDIQKDFSTIKLYHSDRFSTERHNGDLYNMLPKNLQQDDNTEYLVPEINNDSLCIIPTEPRKDVVCNNPLGNKNLVAFRDSFSTSLISYFTYSFGKAKYVWKHTVNPTIMSDADIVILEIVERNLPALVNQKLEIKDAI